MSFKPFEFVYTPPPTVAAPTPLPGASPAGAASAAASSSKPTPLATSLSSQLEDLAATSTYLQQAILSQVGLAGVVIDPTVNPDVARALSAIYATDTPPQFVTMQMYSNLLDAEIGGMQTESALGLDSPFQQNPNQIAAIATVTNAVDQALVSNLTYLNALPAILRTLKGDAYAFQSWQLAAAGYPAVRTAGAVISPQTTSIIQAANIDMSPELATYMGQVYTKFGQAYAGLYGLLSGANTVEQDVNNVIATYVAQPLSDLVQIIGMLNAVRGLSHLSTMEDLGDDLVNFAFSRLVGELSGVMFSIDRLVQMAVSPFIGALGTVAQITNAISQLTATAGRLTSGGLKGMVQYNSCARSPLRKSNLSGQQAYDNLSVPGLNAVTAGVKTLAAHLEWAQFEIQKKQSDVLTQFQRLVARRLNTHGDFQELSCSLRALDGLVSIATSLVHNTSSSSGPSVSLGAGAVSSAPSVSSAQVSSILTNLAGVTKTTFVSNGGQILVTPPAVPNPPDAVVRVLSNAGLRQLNLS